MSNHKKPLTKPFAIRLTDAERTELERRAGEMALGTFIKFALFSDNMKKRRGARSPVKDHVKLAEVLACLGESRLSESMQTLSEAAKSGTLFFDDNLPTTVRKACEDIAIMRLMLMRALGFRGGSTESKESVRQSFTRHARTKDW